MSIEHSIDDILSVKTTRKTANPKKHKLSKSNPSILLTHLSLGLVECRYRFYHGKIKPTDQQERMTNATAWRIPNQLPKKTFETS